MKTADLIPFILLELNECDKYGFELTKAIETKSNGQIVIKQPTLYTLLKKLEKSKFITSYWQDSEIGGKRHYYKLTQNGRLQVSTLPAYEFLLNNVLSDNQSENIDEQNQNIAISSVSEQEKSSIMDELLNSKSPKPVETILPTEELFAENNIDNSTELDLNTANTEILKNNNESIDEQFAANSGVMKFTEKTPLAPIHTPIANVHMENVSNNILDVDFSMPKNELDIKYVDYVDFKNNEKHKHSKKVSSKLLLQAVSTSLSLIAMIIICSIITSFTGRSGLYYFIFITTILISLFYPIIIATNIEKIRLKYQATNYETKTKHKLIIGASAIMLILVICITINICIDNNTIGKILSIKNFANFYAPILISTVYLLDILYNHLFLSKIN